jgi:hypothetical protein
MLLCTPKDFANEAVVQKPGVFIQEERNSHSVIVTFFLKQLCPDVIKLCSQWGETPSTSARPSIKPYLTSLWRFTVFDKCQFFSSRRFYMGPETNFGMIGFP